MDLSRFATARQYVGSTERVFSGSENGRLYSRGGSAFSATSRLLSGNTGAESRDLSGYALFEPGPDGIGDSANIIQGVRNFDPALGTWTTPDAYAGNVSDPMSRKAYMWNRNNPFSYQDRSGYYICDACTDEELKLLESKMSATRAIVETKMKKYKRGSAEYKALAALDQDLQFGKGNWHIRFGSTGDSSSPGNTRIGHTDEETRGTSNFKITSVNPTTFNASLLKSYGVAAIVSEGGIYELGTGRAGAAGLSALTDAVDFTPDNADDFQIDHVVNRWYNVPLGVPCDDVGEDNC